MASVMTLHQSLIIGNVSHTYYTGRSQNHYEAAGWLVKQYLKTKPVNSQPWLTGVTLIRTGDSRIDMLIPTMANNVPRKRIYSEALPWQGGVARTIIDDTVKVV